MTSPSIPSHPDDARGLVPDSNRIAPPAVHLRLSHSGLDWGVFASKAFAEGELVEEAIVFLDSTRLSELSDAFRNRAYNWSYLATGQACANPISAICLGFGSLYNNDNPANLHFEADASRRTIRFSAARPIAANEQLTINYSGDMGRADKCKDKWKTAAGSMIDSPASSLYPHAPQVPDPADQNGQPPG